MELLTILVAPFLWVFEVVFYFVLMLGTCLLIGTARHPDEQTTTQFRDNDGYDECDDTQFDGYPRFISDGYEEQDGYVR